MFGPYPFDQGGGVVDVADISFALETQTRPVYSIGFWSSQEGGDSVVVHELAHQWAGDWLRIERWRDIWLNEGFATYAQWLWDEREGFATVQEIFDFYAAEIPADDPFWSITIGDPGPDAVFEGAVYDRGAMTLQALRVEIGDRAFFRLLRRWVARNARQTVTTEEFIALAERVSGQQLDALFEEWLFTPARPAGLPAPRPLARSAAAAVQRSIAPFGRSTRKR